MKAGGQVKKTGTYWLIICVCALWGWAACGDPAIPDEALQERTQEPLPPTDANIPESQEVSLDQSPDRPEPAPDRTAETKPDLTPDQGKEPTPPEPPVEPPQDLGPQEAPKLPEEPAAPSEQVVEPHTEPDTTPGDASEPASPDDAGGFAPPPEGLSEPPPDAQEPPPRETGVDGGPESLPEPTPEPAPDIQTPACTHLAPLPSKQEWALSTGGGSGFVFVKDIKADKRGFLYLAGTFESNDMTIGATVLKAGTGTQSYLAKLDTSGTFLWARKLPGSGSHKVQGIAVDAKGDLYATGEFQGTLTHNQQTYTDQGGDAFLIKLDTCGDVKWIKQMGGKSYDFGQSVAVDQQGKVYVYGQYSGPASFGTTTLSNNALGNIFVAKFDSSGGFEWVAQGGSASIDTPAGIAVNNKGEAYIAGSTFVAPSFGNTTLTSNNAFELFVAKLDAKGQWLWAKQTVGSGRAVPYKLLVRNDILYMTGELDGQKSFGTLSLTAPAHGDIYIAKMSNTGVFQWVLRPKGTSHLHPYGIDVGIAGNLYVAGDYTGAPGFGATNFPTSNNINSFVARASIVTTPTAPQFDWSTRTKGSNDIRAQALAIDSNGHLYVAGQFQTGGTFGATTLKGKAFSFYIFVWKIPKP